jgi:tetratricopeptide (TPR) repeat protein
MPIISFTALQAMANLRARRSSLWPERWRGADRLKGVAQVEFDPSFALEPGEAVMTIGSCFARNIEARLGELGFRIPARELSLPAEERASDTENDLLNKYTPHSIINELRWAFETPFPDESLLEVRGEWHDPHLASNVAPASLERVRERRAMVAGLYRRLPECRVVVLTLGLVEVWFDTQLGLHLNGAPPTPCLKQEPERFRLEVLSHAQVLAALETIHALLKTHGHPQVKLLVTVSPVPMRATFTGADALVANAYSKATLRSAVGEFVRGHDGVDYFPSYEIATLTLRTTAFQEDNRHVAPALVDAIVDRVVRAYCEGPAAGSAAMPDEDDDAVVELDGVNLKEAGTRLKAAIADGDQAEALKLFAYLDEKDRYKRARFGEYFFRKTYGQALVGAGADIKALGQMERALAEKPGSASLNYELGNVQTRLQRPREAEASFRRAVELDPDQLKYRHRLAARLMDNGGYEEAARELARLAAADPSDERTRALLADARARAGGGQAQAGGLWRRLAKRLGA